MSHEGPDNNDCPLTFVHVKGGGEVKGEYEGFEGRRRAMLTTGEWCKLGTRGLRTVAALWAGIPVSLA